MIANGFLQLSQPARVRSLVDDLLLWSPLPLLVAAAVGRWHGVLAASLVAISGFFLLAIVAWRRARRFNRQWLIRQLDARRMDMEDSADLLFAEEARLSPLQRLQRVRLQQRLAERSTPDLRPAWSSARIAAAWIAGAAVIAALALWPARQETAVLAPSAENMPVVAGVPRLVGQRLRIVPPAYTGLPARDEADLDVKAPQGSHLQWTLRFDPQPAPVTADALIAKATSTRAELRALQHLAERATLEADAARRARLPLPNLFGGLKRAGDVAGRQTGGVFGLSVSLPVFDAGGRESARWAAERARAEAERASIEYRIRSEIIGASEVLSMRQAALSQEPPGAADELVRIAEVAYREGEVGILELLDAVRTASRARTRNIDMRLEARLAQIALERAVGDTLWP